MPSTIIRTPEGPIAVIPTIAEQLKALGVVWSEADGYHAKSKTEVEQRVLSDDIGACDFCSGPKPTAVFEVGDFNMGVPGQTSTGGWAACDTCTPLVKAGDKAAVLARAIAGSSNPGHVFVQKAIAQLHDRFWAAREKQQGQLADDAGTITALHQHLAAAKNPTERALKIKHLAQRLGLPAKRIEDLAAFRTDAELADFIKGLRDKQGDMAAAIDKLNAEIAELQRQVDGHPPKNDYRAWPKLGSDVQFDKARPWMEAIEMQFAALGELARTLAKARQQPLGHLPRDVVYSWGTDIDMLKKAECYTWGAESMAACRLAGRTIPHDTVLRADMLPGRAGWWYFPGPIPVKTTGWDDMTVALLWGQQPGEGVMFSAYVVGRVPDEAQRLRYVPTPTQTWLWPEGFNLHQMLQRVTENYNATAGATVAGRPVAPFPLDGVLKASADLSLFFLAGCAWMQQRILAFEGGHVERHRRKQLAREHNLELPANEVKIIQLRRVERHHGPAPAGTDPVEWSCRWTVDGHWRNQPYGTKHGDRKLIYIMPYVKGPDDKPLKVPAHKVYVVNR